MKITLVVATSQDGFINHIDEQRASDWTSVADQRQYTERLKRYKLQLMGLTTYKAYSDRFVASSLYRRTIFTHHPEKYQSIPGKLEFTNEPIQQVLSRLEADGFKHAVLLGGGILYTEFLKAGLVDEIYQTVEPLHFEKGIPFIGDGLSLKDFPYLALETTIPLNDAGTVLLHYTRK